jgi:CelD/BcsL family acetyltransferase involved in cellulose biosynthesis
VQLDRVKRYLKTLKKREEKKLKNNRAREEIGGLKRTASEESKQPLSFS